MLYCHIESIFFPLTPGYFAYITFICPKIIPISVQVPPYPPKECKYCKKTLLIVALKLVEEANEF